MDKAPSPNDDRQVHDCACVRIFVLAVHATGDFDSTMDCDYAVVSVDDVRPRLTRLMATVARLDEKLFGLKGIEVWDSSPTILSRANAEKLIGEEELEQADQSGGKAIAVEVSKAAWDVALDTCERAECFVLHASEDAVYWDFFPKYTTVGCETAVIPADLLTLWTDAWCANTRGSEHGS